MGVDRKMNQIEIIKKEFSENKSVNKKLLKQTLFTVAYYNALGYYPTSFFIWKNLINIKGDGTASSLIETTSIIDRLKNKKRIIEKNGMYRLLEKQNTSFKKESPIWYKQQIQKNKISTEKIKKAKRWAKRSKWMPYLRGLFLTGTLAMKRGSSNSDWDVLVVLKKDRIWLGRLMLTTWFHLVGKRRYKQKIENRFCLNQFVVDKKLEFKEQNEFLSNELLTTEELMGNSKLKNKIIQKNKNWIKTFKPNFKFRESVGSSSTSRKNNFSKIVQEKLEIILETFKLAKMANTISKKIMIQKIINNPKTYSPNADIRYSDFFLVFLPRPQRGKLKKKAFELLTKMNS